ncbi:MAG: shikimate kinase [Anaerolineae bacterium]
MLRDANIILIGPSGAGKTTLAKMLGEALGMSWFDLDDLRWGYYAEIGYDREYAEALHEAEGFAALIAYWKPFEIYSVERLFQDYPAGHVFAFGAGQSVYDDPAFAERARVALAPHHVILLLPSTDTAESVQILNDRIRISEPELPEQLFGMIGAMNRDIIEHPANASLADLTLYTSDQTPEATRDAILAWLAQS